MWLDKHRSSIASELGIENIDIKSAEYINLEEEEKPDILSELGGLISNLMEIKADSEKSNAPCEDFSIDEEIAGLIGNSEINRFAEDIRKIASFYSNKATLRMEMSGTTERILTRRDFALAASDVEFKSLNSRTPSNRTIGFIS